MLLALNSAKEDRSQLALQVKVKMLLNELQEIETKSCHRDQSRVLLI